MKTIKQSACLMSHVSCLKGGGLANLSVGFIGAGTMGQALIRGLLAQGIAPRKLRAMEIDPAKRHALKRLGVAAMTDHRLLVQWADTIVLAVKPQQYPDVLSVLAPYLSRTQLVISIAAGITLRWLKARLPNQPIIRVMPNLPATVGCGFFAMAFNRAANLRHRTIARQMFSVAGKVVELPERYFDAITAVSGSGPAYVFFLVGAWSAAARTLGLPASIAKEAILQTLVGSARLLQTTREPASILLQKVASKRGTTEAALKVLAKRHVAAHVVEALHAAAKRSAALST
jgi:pyrroline-5-carboxylate reductase